MAKAIGVTLALFSHEIVSFVLQRQLFFFFMPCDFQVLQVSMSSYRWWFLVVFSLIFLMESDVVNK